jgi:type IX secretion system PorP/SprF family membrane protein
MNKAPKYISTQWLLGLLLLFCLPHQTKAQQVPLLDQYYINPLVYNPAMAGHKNLFNGYLMRNQKFQGFDGGQIIHLLTLDAALKEGKYGVGLNLMSDDVGIFNNTQAMLSYSYRLKFANDHILRLGLSAGMADFRINMNQINADPSDPYLINNNYKRTKFSANLGVSYNYKNFRMGFAVPQLLNNSLQEDEATNTTSYQLSRHFLLSGGYRYLLSENHKLAVTPYILMRYAKNSPVQYDFNAIVEMENKGWFAVSYRNQYALGLNLGLHVLKNFKIGYSYDIGIQSSGRYSSNHHEILLGYTFKKKKSSSEPDRIMDKDVSMLRSLLAEKYKKIDRLREELEKMEQEEKLADEDRDGIPDTEDECPQTPPFYIVDQQGCPVDTDGDGVVDSEDYCPDTPGLAGNSGCPEQKEEKIEMPERLENVYFAFGKYYLTEYSRGKLETIIHLMVNNNDYILKMHGHTDDIGNDKTNDQLAYKRLITVKNYLTLNGVPENRILIVPHGERLPVVANTDSKSRAINRRVAFEIYSYR